MEYTLNIARKPNIIVLGDIFLDHTYHANSVARLANEAPIPVYKHTKEIWSLGGAGNVIANLASMGCASLYALGRVGAPTEYHTARISSLLEKYKVNNQLLYDASFPTIVKNRYYCGKTLLFRHDQETTSLLSDTQEDIVIDRIASILSNPETPIDCIVFSDYSKGFLTTRLCQTIIGLARTRKIFTCVDPKDDPTKYIGCSLIKPNRTETYKLFGIQIDGSNTKHAHDCIHEKLGCESSVITLSEHGATLFSHDSSEILHCTNQPMDVIDVTGAGDIVCATLAYLYTIHAIKHEVLKLANILAMISVGHLGSYILEPHDFVKCRSMLHTNKCINANNLRRIIEILHSENRTSVFTNGCFDIIHVGHLDLLRRCKEMGDIVIVGLNSDASISRLKGPERPIMNLEKRAAFLSALEFVDYVVVFDEDTPIELLSMLKPSLLVKGGDYKPEEIKGREFVNEVRIVPFIAGYSSTSVIHTIRDRVS